jgi:glycosyltransferase involved in cell wall biosynthesis
VLTGNGANNLRASVLVAAYEHSDFLRRTLLGLGRQTASDFEVVVCDDGSGPEVRKLVDGFQQSLQGRLKHCRQEKAGFRKCRVLNKGILSAATDYLIFLDGDCIPHNRFIEEHLHMRSPGAYLVGRRVQLGYDLTARLSDEDIRSGELEFFLQTLLPAALRGELRHFEAGLYLPSWLRWIAGSKVSLLKGCNFSCWKSDMVRINGFNEDFVTAGGGEDDDVERRFRMLGLQSRSVKHTAICYHQYHQLVPRGARGGTPVEEGSVECAHGLKQHG